MLECFSGSTLHVETTIKSVLESLKLLCLSDSERPLSYEVLQMWNTRAMALAVEAIITLKLLANSE